MQMNLAALNLPALNLKAKLIVLMVGLLGLTLGAEVWISLGTQEAIVAILSALVYGTRMFVMRKTPTDAKTG